MRGWTLGSLLGKLPIQKIGLGQTQHLDPLRIKWVEYHLKPEFTGERE